MIPVVDTEELAQQATDKELLELESPSPSLKLQKFLLPETNSSLYCDGSQNVRSFVPAILHRRIFDMVHGLSHPSGRAIHSSLQIAQKFV